MEKENNVQDVKEGKIRDVYIVGSKSIGMYGGYESFVRNLLPVSYTHLTLPTNREV